MNALATLHTHLRSPLVRIPEGDFWMGSDESDVMEGPAHRVHVSPFWCARTPVTNTEFSRFVDATGYRTFAERGNHPRGDWRRAAKERDDHPVVMVAWHDAQAYCDWLAATTGVPFRLPTEAEWEKAARGGIEGAVYPWDNRLPEAVGANFGHLGLTDLPRTVPVEQMPANPFGVLVGGNAWEWVTDWYDPHYYQVSPTHDPQGPATGTHKVRRGGAYNNRKGFRLRVTSRNRLEPDLAFPNMSFRVVCADVPGAAALSLVLTGARRRLPLRPNILPAAPPEAAWDDAIRQAMAGRAGMADCVEAVLAVLRPNMEEDEGGVRLVAVEGTTARLQMLGTCRNCPKSPMTFADVAEMVVRHVPEVQQVERVAD